MADSVHLELINDYWYFSKDGIVVIRTPYSSKSARAEVVKYIRHAFPGATIYEKGHETEATRPAEEYSNPGSLHQSGCANNS